MTSTYYCTGQQIMDWHYRTICRYQLAEMPAAGLTNLLKNIPNKLKPYKSPKGQRVLKQPFTWRADTTTNLANTHVLQTEEQTFSDKILLAKQSSTPSQRRKAYVNHVKFWRHMNKITLHITSGKLLSSIELYPSFYMGFCCFGNQGPQIIRSKRAVAEFSVIEGAIIGARSNLQKQNKFYFLYKWAFIAAGLLLIERSSTELVQCLGVDSVFIFPELDKYNYYLFKPISGFDLTFNIQNTKQQQAKPFF